MKNLRILALTIGLGVSLAHAGSDNVISQMIANGAKQIVIMAGIFCIADGILEMADGESFLPSLEVADRPAINGGLKAGIGAVLFVSAQSN